MKSKWPTKPRTPLRRVSKKREIENRLYAVKRKEYLELHPVCERCRMAQSTEIHHIAGRIGPMLNRTEHWAALCRWDHEDIHQHPKLAREQGWLITIKTK